MIQRFANGGIDTVMAESRATDMLYAWAQAGAREDVVQRVAEQSGNDAWLLRFVCKLCGPNSTLSLDGMSTFFDAPAAIVRRIYELLKADPDNTNAAERLRPWAEISFPPIRLRAHHVHQTFVFWTGC